MSVGRKNRDGGKELNRLKHHCRFGRLQSPSHYGQSLLLSEDLLQSHRVVHDGFQTPQALVLDPVVPAIATATANAK